MQLKFLSHLTLGSLAFVSSLGMAGAAQAIPPNTQDFWVSQYGAIPNDGKDDAVAIQNAIDAAIALPDGIKGRLRFNSGKYNLKEYANWQNNPGAASWHCRGGKSGAYLEIKGTGAKDIGLYGVPGNTILEGHNPACSILRTEIGAEDIEVNHLTIDYYYQAYTQGQIVGTPATTGKIYDVRIRPADNTPNFAYPDHPLFDQHTRAGWSVGNYGFVVDKTTGLYGFSAAGEDSVNKVSTHNYSFTSTSTLSGKQMKDGRDYVHIARAYPSAFHFYNTKGVSVKNITMYSSPGLGTVLFNNEAGTRFSGVTFDNYRIEIKPNTNRLLSTVADGIHSRGNRAPVHVKNSYFSGMGDDGINLHGRASEIKTIDGSPNQPLLTFYGTGTQNFRVGDEVGIVARKSRGNIRSGEYLCERTVTAVQKYPWRITLDGPCSGMETRDQQGAPDNDWLFNLSNSSKGSIVEDTIFENHRGRAMVLRGENMIIRRNEVRLSLGNAILIGMAGHPEGPLSDNINIYSNRFYGADKDVDGTSRAGIITNLENSEGFMDGHGINYIRIQHNRFHDMKSQSVTMRNCRSCSIQGNYSYRPSHGSNRIHKGPIILVTDSEAPRLGEITPITANDIDPKVTSGICIEQENCTNCSKPPVSQTNMGLGAGIEKVVEKTQLAPGYCTLQ